MTARDLILERFSTLSPTMQTAAKFVVDHPNEVVTASMRTLADRAHVQPATLVRLAQQLGYAGWPALKSAFTDDLGLGAQHYGARAKSLSKRARRDDLAAELFDAYERNLRETAARSAPLLREAAKLLECARVVHLAGFRASFPIVYSLYYGYRLFRSSVVLVDGLSANLEMLMRAVERDDVVVAASFSPYSREALLVVDAARTVGAKLVAITDSAASPLALAADVALLFSPTSPSFFPSVAGGVAVAEGLLEQIVADAGARVVKRIDAAERQLVESGAYVHGTGRHG